MLFRPLYDCGGTKKCKLITMHCTVKLEQIRAKKYKVKKLNPLDHGLECSAPETTEQTCYIYCLNYA